MTPLLSAHICLTSAVGGHASTQTCLVEPSCSLSLVLHARLAPIPRLPLLTLPRESCFLHLASESSSSFRAACVCAASDSARLRFGFVYQVF